MNIYTTVVFPLDIQANSHLLVGIFYVGLNLKTLYLNMMALKYNSEDPFLE